MENKKETTIMGFRVWGLGFGEKGFRCVGWGSEFNMRSLFFAEI